MVSLNVNVLKFQEAFPSISTYYQRREKLANPSVVKSLLNHYFRQILKANTEEPVAASLALHNPDNSVVEALTLGFPGSLRCP